MLTNAFGHAIAEGIALGLDIHTLATRLAEHPEEKDDAEAAIRSVLSAWNGAGLLARDKPDFPHAVAFSGEPDTMPLRFSGPGGVAHVHVPDAVLSEQLQTVMGHMIHPQHPKIPIRQLVAQPDADGFAIFRNGTAVSGRIGLDAARFVLMREVAEAICGPQDVASVFHAGCVSLNGKALLISGESGQGKSTLTFGLVAAGCAYLGDDHVPLHRDGQQVISFPTAAGVKPGSWNLPEIHTLQDQFGLTPRSPREGVRYIPLQDAGAIAVGTALPVQAIVIPHYRQDISPEIRRISPEQALIQILKAGSRLSESHQGDIAPLAELLNHVPAYELRFSRSDQSVSACLSLLQNPLP